MKKKLLLTLIIFAMALIATKPAAAFSGVSGLIVDEYGDPWLWGGTLYAWNSTDYTMYINGTTIPTSGAFDIAWDTVPPLGTNIEVFIIFNDPGGIYPAPTPVSVMMRQLPPTGSFSLGNVSTNTGPNSLVVSNLTAQSGNTWLPFALLIGSVALVSGAVAIIRKRRA